MKSSAKGDLLFTLSVSLLFLTSAGLLAHDLFFSANASGGRQIGIIEMKSRTTEHRQSGSSLWQALAANSPVYNHDTVRTGEGSSAVISVFDSGSIVLGEQSLVYVSVDEQKRASVSVSQGEIAVSAAAGSVEPLRISTSSGNMTISGGSVSVSETGGRTRIKPLSGSAVLARDNSGESILLDGTLSIDTETGKFTPSPLTVRRPLPGEVFPARDELTDVTFSLDGTWNETDVLRVLKSRTTGGEGPQEVTEYPLAREIPVRLGAGTYSWEIPGSVEAGSFSVMRVHKPNGLRPDGNVIAAQRNVTPVLLEWNHYGEETRYVVSVFSSTDSGSPILSRSVQTRTARVEVPGTGTFTWSVLAFHGSTAIPVPSDTARFTIEERPLAAPELSQTAEDLSSSTVRLAEGKPLLRWAAVPGAQRYESVISEDPEQRIVIAEETSRRPVLQQPETLPAGEYYVRVRAATATETSPWSEPVKVTVKPVEPLTPLAPAEGERIGGDSQTIRFVWHDPNEGSVYRLSLSDDESFITLSADKQIRRNEVDITLPSGRTGTFFWKVELLDRDNRILASTPVSRFVRPKIIPVPERLSPSGRTFELSTMEPLEFSWTGQTGIDGYRIAIYRSTGGILNAVGEWTVTDTRFELADLSMLAIDTFTWEVRALGRDENGEAASSEPARSYFRIKKNKPLPVPGIKQLTTRGQR